MSFEGIDWPFKGMKLSESEEVKEEGLCLSVLSYDKPHAPPVTTAAHSGTIVLSTGQLSTTLYSLRLLFQHQYYK